MFAPALVRSTQPWSCRPPTSWLPPPPPPPPSPGSLPAAEPFTRGHPWLGGQGDFPQYKRNILPFGLVGLVFFLCTFSSAALPRGGIAGRALGSGVCRNSWSLRPQSCPAPGQSPARQRSLICSSQPHLRHVLWLPIVILQATQPADISSL